MAFRLRIAGARIFVIALAIPFLLAVSLPAFSQEMKNLLDDIRKIELSTIKINEQSPDYYSYLEGRIPILISAPHGTKHYRKQEGRGYWKKEDAYTSAIAIELGRLTGAHVIYTNYKAGEDPNNDTHCAYKEFLEKAVKEHDIRFIVDLHGASGSQPFKIDVGTLSNTPGKSSCPTFRPVIAKAFKGFEEQVFNKRFTADHCATITSFAERTWT
jgi:hypothetical protein